MCVIIHTLYVFQNKRARLNNVSMFCHFGQFVIRSTTIYFIFPVRFRYSAFIPIHSPIPHCSDTETEMRGEYWLMVRYEENICLPTQLTHTHTHKRACHTVVALDLYGITRSLSQIILSAMSFFSLFIPCTPLFI